MGKKQFGPDNFMIDQICEDIKEVHDLGYEICLVVGGGNICRGTTLAEVGVERVAADHMGMLATLINAVALQSKLESKGLCTRVSSALPIITIVEQYIRRKAIRHLEKGRVVIFASGTGNPFFTTDTAAVLRAIEMNCQFLLKGSRVDGVYDADPLKNPQAKKFKKITYSDTIKNNIKVMDTAAVALAKDNKMPMMVFNISKKGELAQVLKKKGSFTEII